MAPKKAQRPIVDLPLSVTDADTRAEHLYRQGWVTLPLLTPTEIQEQRALFFYYLSIAPEHVPDLPRTHKFAKTGFATLGTSSSFHAWFARELRRRAFTEARSTFAALALRFGGPRAQQEYNVDTYVDRLMVRQGKHGDQSAQASMAESWHRDESVDDSGQPMPDTDKVFGGWINLNFIDEFLSGAPGTHFTDRNRGTGFGALSAQDIAAQDLERKAVRARVPPGHLLIFFENMAHEVISKAPAANTTQMRLFTGFRMTLDRDPVYEDLLRRLMRMDWIRLKSGQRPPIWARLNWTNNTQDLQQWTLDTLVPALHYVGRQMMTGTRQGQRFTVPVQAPEITMFKDVPEAPALLDDNGQAQDWVMANPHLDLHEFEAMFPPYTRKELQLYIPRPVLAPLDPGDANDAPYDSDDSANWEVPYDEEYALAKLTKLLSLS